MFLTLLNTVVFVSQMVPYTTSSEPAFLAEYEEHLQIYSPCAVSTHYFVEEGYLAASILSRALMSMNVTSRTFCTHKSIIEHRFL